MLARIGAHDDRLATAWPSVSEVGAPPGHIGARDHVGRIGGVDVKVRPVDPPGLPAVARARRVLGLANAGQRESVLGIGK